MGIITIIAISYFVFMFFLIFFLKGIKKREESWNKTLELQEKMIIYNIRNKKSFFNTLKSILHIKN